MCSHLCRDPLRRDILTPVDPCGEFSPVRRWPHIGDVGPVLPPYPTGLLVGGGRNRPDDEPNAQDPASAAHARDDDRRSVGATAHVVRLVTRSSAGLRPTVPGRLRTTTAVGGSSAARRPAATRRPSTMRAVAMSDGSRRTFKVHPQHSPVTKRPSIARL
jgi:hypothetical protein